MTDTSIFAFSNKDGAEISLVGGKGYSLIKMSGEGLAVPPGFVLSVKFFRPWLEELKKSAAWQSFLAADEQSMQTCCRELKKMAGDFCFNSGQTDSIADFLEAFDDDFIFAVRSSSPEEDLEGSSFAGGYETVLGVKKEDIESAVRKAFASCLDHRVAVYKKENGFDYRDPKIAVVVQKQIASDIAGVAFSLNPVSNDYDEAVINANWGLGETVVSGMASPDTFVVDKVNWRVRDTVIGTKETSIWLNPEGGTAESPDARRDQPSLDEEQVIEVGRLTRKVEDYYAKPMDIEWAYEKGKLYLLQARPVTSYVPLSSEMLTPEGEKRRLYLDITISVQGLFKPISVMGTDAIKGILRNAGFQVFSKDITSDIETALPWVENGRVYLNVSNVFALAGKEHFVKAFRVMDPLASDAMDSVDEYAYSSDQPAVKTLPLNLLWKLPDKAFHLLEARLQPEQAHRKCQLALDSLRHELKGLLSGDLIPSELLDRISNLTTAFVFNHSMPLFIASKVAMSKIRAMFGDKEQELVGKLDRSLPHNVTVEMGLELYEVSKFLPARISESELRKGLEDGSLPGEFRSAWSEFLNKYGHRGIEELDIANRRYREDPGLLLSQLVTLRNATEPEEDPRARYDRSQKERAQAFEKLAESIHTRGWIQAKRFQSLYRVVKNLGGYRELHKFCVIYAIDVFRSRLMEIGHDLVGEGRLDRVEDVFDLNVKDLDEGLKDSKLNLRSLASENRRFPDRLSRLPRLPQVIDSRGRIIRPPARAAKQGEVSGMPISPGVARGRVKVLHSPDEKRLEPGEILVARATDPGWTPLFVNAGAVVLEVGGVLQHGALVAREYGLPCVGGVQEATTLWEDGTVVEVDGSAGIIRKLEAAVLN